MIEKFNLWAESLIVAIAITTIIEMLLPEGNNKKYVKMVCSIYILFTIVNPILNFSKSDISNFKFENQTIETSNIDNKRITDIYISAYEDEIKNKLINDGYNLIDVKLNLDNSLENIENIEIKTYYISEEEKANLIEKINKLYSINSVIIK